MYQEIILANAVDHPYSMGVGLMGMNMAKGHLL